jgi:phosphoglycolate phosphatase
MMGADGLPKVPVKAVMIDLDGTLLDTVPDLAEAANGMLAELGRAPLPVAALKSYVGNGIPNLVWRCLSQEGEATEAEVARALAVFRRHYFAVNGRRTTIFPGVVAGLDRMQAMGLSLACITNKAADFTEPLLERVGLRARFRIVVSGDTLPEKKPHPLPLLHVCRALAVEPRHALVIGDSGNDVQAAREAGCPVFCVPYGYSAGRDVRELGCDAIVSSLDEAAGRLVAV